MFGMLEASKVDRELLLSNIDSHLIF